jgi:peptidoglycan/LPS O-acetylase OafA/YrhL
MRSTRNPGPLRSRTFAQAFNPRNNAFGFLRLALAVLVVFSHCFPLGGFGRDPLDGLSKGRLNIGLVAVAMFFALSGFLIARSASTCPSIIRFLWHRFLRIFPGYWVCLVVCACLFVPVMSFIEFDTLTDAFSLPWNSPQEFMIGNAALFHLNEFSIPGIMYVSPNSIAGLLRQNPTACILNGTLWTLPIEVSCYLAVAALAAVGLLRRARFVVAALFVVSWGLYAFYYLDPIGFWSCFPYRGLRFLVTLCPFFAAGCACFVYREKIPYSLALFVISVVLLAVSLPFGAFGLVAPIAIPYAFLWLAFALPFARFDRKGDFSYGTYIYAFPAQQTLALLRLQDFGFIAFFAGALLVTSVFAFLSYRLIEAPCLRWKTLTIPSCWRRAETSALPLGETGPAPSPAPAIV